MKRLGSSAVFHAERVDERERDVFHVETAEREVELQIVVLVQEEHLLRLRHPFPVRAVERERRARDVVGEQRDRHLGEFACVRLRRDRHVVCARFID